ncbi:glucuronate isomerase [Bacillus tianshenii]|uniref:Uronate isomerase n=1 Tax=Sutcliffiella tianshenii TaxID=1463404 RepID=A0ABS2P3M6_9BACI|nr:glucuronate isomerase [Bacillus tianshenii]MBM7621567.1 glucuronate isomerase [Bacillus tianshenii]
MKPFIHDDFLLPNKMSQILYHDYAKDQPIYDYHCHLDPKEIWENKRFASIGEIWLAGDHYKWRAMRINGVPERYITGAAPDVEKFFQWAKTVPHTLGNPLYHWTHLELARYFDFYDLLNEGTAQTVWDNANEKLAADTFRTREIISRSNVRMIGTTDDPTDSLEYHEYLAEDKTWQPEVLPTFRPDRGIEITKDTFLPWMEKLSRVTDKEIARLDDLLDALKERMDYFHEKGARLSDHGMGEMVFETATKSEVDAIFQKALNNKRLSMDEERKYKTFILIFLGQAYAEKGWTMQLHIGAMRNNNKRMFEKVGADAGFDTIEDHPVAKPLAKYLDALDYTDQLPRTILYNLNPKDNFIFASLAGSYHEEGVPGKVQFGSGWWYNDQKDGMERQMTDLANIGLLSRFIGMLTDSRSFLSYTRHEYFRRILCNMIGGWVEKGEAPHDERLLGSLVKNISFENAMNYFERSNIAEVKK